MQNKSKLKCFMLSIGRKTQFPFQFVYGTSFSLCSSCALCCSHPWILAVSLVLFGHSHPLFIFFSLCSFSLILLVLLYFYSMQIFDFFLYTFDFFSQVSSTLFHTGIAHSCSLLIFSLIST